MYYWNLDETMIIRESVDSLIIVADAQYIIGTGVPKIRGADFFGDTGSPMPRKFARYWTIVLSFAFAIL